jgi:alkyl hydroperoxide reductase subunit AhpC
MALSIGETAPDFRAETTAGPISFHDWLGSSWCLLFSHPKGFTPVCTTELGTMARMKPEFDKRDVKNVGLSVDSIDNHAKWSRDIEAVAGIAPNYPMIGDTDLKVAKLYGMLPASAAGTSASRTPADNATVRTVYIIGPDRQI